MITSSKESVSRLSSTHPSSLFALIRHTNNWQFGTKVVGPSSLHKKKLTLLHIFPFQLRSSIRHLLHLRPSHPFHTSDTTLAHQNVDSSSGSSDAKEQNQKAHTYSEELEKQVEKLHLELDLKLRLMEALKTRSKELDQKMLHINTKLQEKN
ncbi:unnamed protein product [Lactuca saligna]|uniref:Uncharacterized protein n=1 Tax=Lactuca saligna TaxID=75948 RepID=A0AA35VER0_LACSI|nr:unnamed protein product [Lactuca saligna]